MVFYCSFSFHCILTIDTIRCSIQQLLVEADKLPDVNHHHLKTHQHNEDQLGHEDGSNEFNRRWLHRFTEFICCGDTTADDNGERFTVL